MRLALLVAAWLAGLLLGLRVDADPLPLLLLALAVLPLGLLLRLTGHSVWPVALVGILLLALLSVEATDSPPALLVTQDGQTVTLQGRVTNDPEATDQKTRFVLAIAAIDRGDGWQELDGKALVYADPPASLVSMRKAPYFRYGDTLQLQGRLEEPRPFGDFDYPTYLASQGIHSILWARQTELVSQGAGSRWRGWIYDLRRELSESIEEALPQSQSSLAQALLLGLRGRMSPEVVEDFRTTGTSHLLAISGLHVGVLLVLSLGAASWWFGRRRHLYLLLPLACICFYALVSGLPASVVRAAIMGSIYLAALALGRPRSALPALAFAAAVMAAINPRVLEQVSFQLSFAAMAGIVLALPVVAGLSQTVTTRLNTTMGWWQRWLIYLSGWVLGALVVSVAATLATLPLIAFNFHQIPLLGILVTVLALPALPFILVGTLATALAGLVHPALGQFFGWLTWGPLSYLLGLVALAPGKTVSGAWASAPLVWAWYIVLGGALLVPGSLSYLKGLPGRFATSVWHPALGSLAASRPTGLTLGFLGLALVLAVAGMFLWVQVFSGPDGKLHVYFFDVGQGDSTLIVTPNGRQVLVDGGPGAESATRALAGPLSRWDRSLDLVALTHPDADHGRGLLEVLDRYEVAGVLVGVEAPESPLHPQWQATLDRQGLTAIPVSSGYRIMLEEDVTLEVLNPPPIPFRGSASDRNNNGVVFRLVYGELSFLLAADIEALVENYLVRQGSPLESVVLKVPHHGSNTSSTAEFLERVNPLQAVISSGEDNPFGHPRPQVVARLEGRLGEGGIYQTAQQGDVEFISDGRRLWVRTQR